jgi:hypothetical protein
MCIMTLIMANYLDSLNTKKALLSYVVLEGGNSVILILVHDAVLPLSMLVATSNFGTSLGVEI